MPLPLLAAGVASLIARAVVSTAAKRALTAAAVKGLTKRQVAELVVRNEIRSAKTLANTGVKTSAKRYEYQGTKYSDPKLDKAFRDSPDEGSVAAMAKRMLEQNPEKVAAQTAEKIKVVMARNQAETVARTAKKETLTTTAPKVKRIPTTKPTRIGSAEEAALVAKRVRPPAGYSGAKVVKPVKPVIKPVDISVKVIKPTTKRTSEEIKAAKDVARKRSIAANPRGKITGKDSVTKKPIKLSSPRGPEEAARVERLRKEVQAEMRKKDYKNKGQAERQRDVDAEEVPQGQTIREKFFLDSTIGIPARSTRGNKTIDARAPRTREDLPPKDELIAIKKAFAELSKEEKAAMREMDARGIQGILREKILKGPGRKPAGPKDAPKRNYVTVDRRIEMLKAQARAKRKQGSTIEQRITTARKQLTPAQRKTIAEAIVQARRNSK